MADKRIELADELVAVTGHRVLLPETLVVKNEKDGKPPTYFAGAFVQSSSKQTVVEIQVYSATFILLKVYSKNSRGTPVDAKMQKSMDLARTFLQNLP